MYDDEFYIWCILRCMKETGLDFVEASSEVVIAFHQGYGY